MGKKKGEGRERKGHQAKGKGHPERKGGGAPTPSGGDLSFPAWFPPVLYGAVTLLLFRRFVFSGQMLFGQDTLALGFMARDFFAQALRHGVFPFWNPMILGGTPFLDSLAGGDSLYPTSILLVLMEPYRALGWKLMLHVFAAGLFTYGWIRALGRSRTAALLCGLAYLLAPFMITLVFPGHDGKLFVTALTPLLFWATERALEGGRLKAFGGMALVIGLVILTTHFQQAYFLFGSVGIYAFVRVVLQWRGGLAGSRAAGRFGLFLAFSLLGAGVSAIQLLPAVSYVTEYSRRTSTTTQASQAGSVAYSSSWSLHPEEVVSLVVPEFTGNNAGGAEWTTGTYWGRNPMKINHEYAGLLVLLLAVVGLLGGPARGVRLTFLGIGGVALLFGLGAHTPVWRLFYELVPGISLFRAPSISAFLFGFSAVTLMGFGIDRILGTGQEEHERRKMMWFLGGVTGILLLGALLASWGTLTTAWVSLFYGTMDPRKVNALARAQPFIARGFLVATALAGATLVLVWGAQKRKISKLLWVLGIGLLITVDQARVDDPFIQVLDFQSWSAPDANIRYLMERMDEDPPFRVLAMGGDPGIPEGQDVKPAIHGIELAAGHHPNDLARYRELIGMVGSGLPANFFTGEGTNLNQTLLSILNVRYVLWPVHLYGGLQEGTAVMATSLDGQSAYEAVYEVPTLPRARLVGEAVVLSEDETVPYLLSADFEPAEEVVVTEPVDSPLQGGPVDGEVVWVEKALNRHILTVRSSGPALLVMAENWYPSWAATVNGAPTPVLRANHTLRAVPVPAGESQVEVYYARSTLLGPLLVSLLSVAVACAAVFLRLPGQGRSEAKGHEAKGPEEDESS